VVKLLEPLCVDALTLKDPIENFVVNHLSLVREDEKCALVLERKDNLVVLVSNLVILVLKDIYLLQLHVLCSHQELVPVLVKPKLPNQMLVL
jgi:hypothetical protein